MNPKVFSTDSFVLASFLLCESCRLLSLNKGNPRRVIFVFEETKDRQQLSELFLSHKAKVEPHRFFSAQKDLKQMLYDN